MAVLAIPVVLAMVSCEEPIPVPAPAWADLSSTENEYDIYLKPGTAAIHGQAFLTQKGGGVVRAAGNTVTLDPATTIGNEWWLKAGKSWSNKDAVPKSLGFAKARKVTVADADGKFKFTGIPAGKYYVRTEVTWEAGQWGIQGGLVGTVVEVAENQTSEIIVNHRPQ